MIPRLIAVDGPLKGSEHPLTAGDLTIGRDSSNDLCLDDPSVSRRHCLLRGSGGRWTLTDLDTRNGTFVNRLPVKSRVLESCDEVRIGTSLFLFVLGDEEPGRRLAAARAEPEFATRSMTIAAGSSLYLDARKLADQLALGSRHGQELKALLALSTTLPSLGDCAAMSRRLMEQIFETLPGERGCLLLPGGACADPGPAYGWQRGAGPAPAPDRTLAAARRSIEERAGLLEEFEDDARGVLAAPLLSASGVLGAVALESGPEAAAFDEGHLEWLAAAAAIAAPSLDCALRMSWLEEENRRLLAEANRRYNMVGESARMREVFEHIARVAPAESTVLIKGETGTGKELVARAIHNASRRAARPFVAINCATLSETLLESDLFGHEKGAFTGAVAQKRGKIEAAEGGTLFLDEIGELAPALQAKLLRVLQEREFERVGGLRPIRADVRLVAATNRDLEESVRAGGFRRDLFYRIHVVAITVPALRERREDIPLLASYFLSRFAEKTPRRVAGISPAARACLMAYDWPGNVRELENSIERAVVLGAGEMIAPEDLPETLLERDLPAGIEAGRFHNAVREMKRRLIVTAIEEAGGSHQEAARRLGLNPTYLSRLIRNLELKKDGNGI